VVDVGRVVESSELPLSEVIGALSYALDATDGQPAGHSLRSCVIGMRLVGALGLGADAQAAAFYGLLMKDAGCSSNSAAVSALYGGDEISVKRALRTVNQSKLSEAAGFAIGNAAGPRQLLRVALAGKRSAREMTEIRCERGAQIASMLGLPEGAAAAIGSLGEHWDGKGHPVGLAGGEIPLLSRVFQLAQTVEVFVRDFGIDIACEMAVSRSGTWFDPMLVELLLSLRGDSEFWQTLQDEQTVIDLGQLEPREKQIVADDERLDRVAEAFALVIDAKSPYTYRHSTRVAELAVAAASALDFEPDALRDLRRAGLLHDIGKLAVPNSILDKPGRLTDDERRRVEQHPQLSEGILHRIGRFSEIAAIAGAHHEKLDGSGYWRGLTGDLLPMPARVLAVADVYEALTADRPYRAALHPEEALSILNEQVRQGKLCGDSVTALEATLETGQNLLAA
jgi:putative nucleotidyltransferase with HDIG domain